MSLPACPYPHVCQQSPCRMSCPAVLPGMSCPACFALAPAQSPDRCHPVMFLSACPHACSARLDSRLRSLPSCLPSMPPACQPSKPSRHVCPIPARHAARHVPSRMPLLGIHCSMLYPQCTRHAPAQCPTPDSAGNPSGMPYRFLPSMLPAI